MKSVPLNNGVERPMLGFGAFQVPDPAECERSVLNAIDTGYRLIGRLRRHQKGIRQFAKKPGLEYIDLYLIHQPTIRTLDTNASLFFDHRDPAMVNWPGERKLTN